MRIIPFPTRSDRDATALWLSELDGALAGHGTGPAAESWRLLEQDVRVLAPALDPEFERELHERLKARRAAAGRATARGASWRHRLTATSGSRRPALAVLATLALLAIVVPAAVIETGSPGGVKHSVAGSARVSEAGPEPANLGRAEEMGPASGPGSAVKGPAVPAAATSSPVTAEGQAAPTPEQGGRLQQLAASLTLTSAPNAVQELADRVSALAVRDGGFVARSQVQQQSKGTSEAQLVLQLPSTKLAAALAALGRLAPVQSQSQSLQDITNSYRQASGRLADARIEHEQLLKALGRATTESEIESLHARIAEARRAIERAEGEVKAVSRRASNAQVEVTVLGTQKAQGGGGLTLHRGLHDVGRVLLVTLIALAIAAAVLVPLGLVLLAGVAGRRAWLRHRREQVLSRA